MGNENKPSDASGEISAEEHKKALETGYVTKSHLPGKTADEDRLPVYEKALYGMGSPSLGLVNQVIEYQVQQVMVYGLGMSPAIKGLIIMIFRIWDAFTDPLMGWISVNTRSRYGRRRPYMFFGSFAMCLLLPFVWRFNENWDMLYICIWFTLFGMIMSTATTVFNIPYQTLKMEMTPDYNERTSINVYSGIIIKLFFIVFGPWVWFMTQHPFFTGQTPGEEPNTLLGIRNVSIWFAVLVLICGLIPTFVCKERYYAKAAKNKKEPLFRSLGLTFQSKPFRLMLLFIFTMNLEGLVLGMGGYISLYHVFEGDKVFAAAFTGFAGTIGGFLGLAALPLIGWVAARYGKEKSLIMVTLCHILMGIGYLIFYNPDNLRWIASMPAAIGLDFLTVDYRWLVMVPGTLNGVLVAALWTVVPAMKADIVDDDEARTGERREGSFESIFSWFLRFTGTVFAGLSGFIVVGLGFDIARETMQDPGVFTRMIIVMGTIPMCLGALQAYLIWQWPLTPDRMADIRVHLENMRGKIDMQSDSTSVEDEVTSPTESDEQKRDKK